MWTVLSVITSSAHPFYKGIQLHILSVTKCLISSVNFMTIEIKYEMVEWIDIYFFKDLFYHKIVRRLVERKVPLRKLKRQ